jgi:mitochondrial fission protein ELM1
MNARATSDPASSLRVWYMTTGETGTRHQARGLALALSPSAEERTIRVSRLWAALPAKLFSRTLAGISEVEGCLKPPWPDVLVTCGRRSALAAMALQHRNTSPMVMVHIQPPAVPQAFDLVVVMAHDELSGDNVVQARTALHGVRAEALAVAGGQADPRFARLPRPWTGVLLGGSTQRHSFTAEDARALITQLDALRAATGGSLLITPSRRTPAAAVATLGWRYASDPSVFLWDGDAPNPYLAILASSDHLVVTSDSISMISEALATRAQVLIHSAPTGGRHERFVADLLCQDLVARIGAPPPPPRLSGLDEMPRIAARVEAIVARKLGTVGEVRALALSAT